MEVPSQDFRAADGRVATVAVMAAEYAWDLERLSEPQAECDGDMIPRQTRIWRSEPLDASSRITMTFDDESAVQLFVESVTEVADTCSEMVGRWEGVEGAFEGRSGTYRWTDDLLQDELVLTES